MKMRSFTIALALVCGVALAASASEKEKNAKSAKTTPPAVAPKPAKPAVTEPHKEANSTVTGSYIKRDLHRNGVVTDSTSPLYVLDQDAIRNSGGADLSQVLIRRGFHR